MGNKDISRLKKRLKQSSILRVVFTKAVIVFREIVFIVQIIRSGRLFAYRKNFISHRQLQNQKVLTYMLNLPPLKDYHDLINLLDSMSIHYKEGGFCLYIPPQEKVYSMLKPVLSNYPPNSGLKILKDLKAPDEAIYCSTDVNPNSPRISDWIGYRPADYLRVANYLFEQGLGPRIYDLIEIKTSHNNLTSYVVQHVAGRIPTEGEFTAFLEQVDRLAGQQLIPMLTEWRKERDFSLPDCRGNLIWDEATGKALYVDFQGFMLKDAMQNICQIAHDIRKDVHFGNKHWIRGGEYLYQSIPGLYNGKRDINIRWRVFKEILQKQGVSIESSIVLDIGCNAGMVIYSALIDGAAWAVGWDRPNVASAAQKLLLSLGVTRFDIYGVDISSSPNLHLPIPQNVISGKNSILFYLSMRKHIGFPDTVAYLPFKYMVYEDHFGIGLSESKDYLREIERRWSLKIEEITSYRDGDGNEDHVVAILHRQ